MHDYTLADRLAAGETVYTVWSSIPETGLLEQFALGPFGAVTLDMQHGGHHVDSVLNGMVPVIKSGKAAVVRVPLGDFGMASRALDFGADAVIAPMINSVEDAIAFRDAMKYPPLGGRSWGVSRALQVRGVPGGPGYLKSANAKTVSFAMIETREAFEIAEDIAAIDGIDGLFLGPSDFSIAWSGGATVDPALADMQDAVVRIADIARSAGKHAGAFAANPAKVPQYAELGYRFISVAMDFSILAEGQKAVLAAAGAAQQGS
ncbi:MAG: 2,4-dihydroxyhept-2-ene-1,7-dioic acid aldolase [Ahrensia sp.]|nr:2,4-dihydroxyhept-2-ene-1,7-dioic acid aldolase [Ahrensia sp.]